MALDQRMKVHSKDVCRNYTLSIAVGVEVSTVGVVTAAGVVVVSCVVAVVCICNKRMCGMEVGVFVCQD